jgi:hypothetical protein
MSRVNPYASIVLEYIDLARQYHPELFTKAD